jgi:hypothetical protein
VIAHASLDKSVGPPESHPKKPHPTGAARKDHHSFAKLL